MKDKDKENVSAQMLMNLSQNAQASNLYAGLFPTPQTLLSRITNAEDERKRIEELTK